MYIDPETLHPHDRKRLADWIHSRSHRLDEIEDFEELKFGSYTLSMMAWIFEHTDGLRYDPENETDYSESDLVWGFEAFLLEWCHREEGHLVKALDHPEDYSDAVLESLRRTAADTRTIYETFRGWIAN